ncbi:ABC transporter substrate-binding protein [Streptosporangium saharense]|uniref:Iron complex transport system substrate-binding protein n=1 Tax=Streptosporangium saharense TaxID=1706840 RepID=A0A7W7QH71_9ACTN|nr:ABC transporter substrate-binding protein [Streptosporangium saharense]MBB4913525.1 iron complex transport system substrate-binding protein [Streptosporangium saharense]
MRKMFVAALVCVGLVTACGAQNDPVEKAAADPSAPAASAEFPMTLTNAWGKATIEKKPVRVATVSDGDTSIALALGLVPVIVPDVEDGDPPAEYKKRAMDKLGVTELKTYDDTDGVDYEAIAAEAPDVILAVNNWQMDTSYAKLAPVAPIVTFAKKEDADTLPWQERLKTAAKALGLSAKADEVIAANRKTIADAAAANPAFKGKTYTYAVIHPEQVTFMSYGDQDPGVFEDLGLRKTDRAKDYSADKNSVSLENLDQLDADVLLITFPFGDEGLLSLSELESNKLFQSLGAVKNKHFAVVPSENTLSSSIAYPDALSSSWVVEQLTPILAKAVAGA